MQIKKNTINVKLKRSASSRTEHLAQKCEKKRYFGCILIDERTMNGVCDAAALPQWIVAWRPIDVSSEHSSILRLATQIDIAMFLQNLNWSIIYCKTIQSIWCSD